MKRKRKTKLTYRQWLRTLSNEIIHRLANDWRRDVAQTKLILGEYNRRLRTEAKEGATSDARSRAAIH